MLMLQHIGSMFGGDKQKSGIDHDSNLCFLAYSAQVPQMEDGTLEIDAEALLKKTPLPKVGISSLKGTVLGEKRHRSLKDVI